jgi:hypothetical protein
MCTGVRVIIIALNKLNYKASGAGLDYMAFMLHLEMVLMLKTKNAKD